MALVAGFLISASCSPTCGPAITLGVTRALLKDMELFSEYSSAIYCDNNAVSPKGTPITCRAADGYNSCPSVEGIEAFVYGNFFNVGYYSGTGVLAVDPHNKQLVLVFRGAEYLGATTKALPNLIPCHAVCKACKCHEGFYTAWTEVRPQAISLVKSARIAYPNYRLIITGHSLGATQSGYAAAEFRANGTKATLYNYGGPHIGDINFAEFVTSQGDNYRVTHTTDPAPRIGDPNSGYRHISPEYWIYEDRNQNFTVSTDQIQVIQGFNSIFGNEVSTILTDPKSA